MQTGVLPRRLTQWGLSAVLVGGILLAAWYSSSNNRNGGSGSAFGWRSTADNGSPIDEDEPSEQRQLEIMSMPASVELQRSLQRLDEARDTLLKEAADGSAEAGVRAVRNYQQAVQTVREGMERLRGRMTPDEYHGFWARLASEREDGREDGFSLRAADLGILPIGGTP